MTIEQLVDRIGDYLIQKVSPNMKSNVTKFALGAASSATGKRIIATRIEPIAQMLSDAGGNLDGAGVRDVLLSGIRSAGSMDLLGIVTFSEADVQDFLQYAGL